MAHYVAHRRIPDLVYDQAPRLALIVAVDCRTLLYQIARPVSQRDQLSMLLQCLDNMEIVGSASAGCVGVRGIKGPASSAHGPRPSHLHSQHVFIYYHFIRHVFRYQPPIGYPQADEFARLPPPARPQCRREGQPAVPGGHELWHSMVGYHGILRQGIIVPNA